jgi:hypothetical protein
MTSQSARAGIAQQARKERISYPLSYDTKDLLRQIRILCEQWPEIDPTYALALAARINPNPEFPHWLEAPFCIVNPDFFGSYTAAVIATLDALIVAREKLRTSVHDNMRSYHLKDRDLESCLRSSARSAAFRERLRKEQPGPLWIVYGQFGWHHRDRSPAEVAENYHVEEYGFGLLEAACMLLTHRRRFVNSKSLQIECPGDEFLPSFSEKFIDTPFIRVVEKGQLFVDVCLSTVSGGHAGSITGMLPRL